MFFAQLYFMYLVFKVECGVQVCRCFLFTTPPYGFNSVLTFRVALLCYMDFLWLRRVGSFINYAFVLVKLYEIKGERGNCVHVNLVCAQRLYTIKKKEI